MELSDFLLIYPCYFLLTRHDELESVVIESEKNLCLFTDDDLVETYYRAKYGEDASDFEALVFERQEQLLGALRHYEPALADQGVLHLAIDPTPGKRVARVLIRQFIEHLEQGD